MLEPLLVASFAAIATLGLNYCEKEPVASPNILALLPSMYFVVKVRYEVLNAAPGGFGFRQVDEASDRGQSVRTIGRHLTIRTQLSIHLQ